MRLKLEGDETRDDILESLSHVADAHRVACNEHLRRMFMAEADELLDALAAFSD